MYLRLVPTGRLVSGSYSKCTLGKARLLVCDNENMALYLRRALADDDVEIPEHYEGVPLKRTVLLLGWTVGLVLTVGGVSVMVLTAGTLFEAAGALCAAGGAIALAAVIRCRLYEIQVGRRWIKIGAGPLTRRFKSDLVAVHRQRTATGWRRLYADHEVVLILSISDDQHIVPTRDPTELQTAF